MDFADCIRVVQFNGSSVACISCKLVVKSRGLIYSGSACMTTSQVVLCISIRRHTLPVCLSLWHCRRTPLAHWQWQNVDTPILWCRLGLLAGNIYKWMFLFFNSAVTLKDSSFRKCKLMLDCFPLSSPIFKIINCSFVSSRDDYELMDWNLSDVLESILVIIIIEVQIASPGPAGAFLSVLLNLFDLTLQDFDSFPARCPRLMKSLPQTFNQTFLQGFLVSFTGKWAWGVPPCC